MTHSDNTVNLTGSRSSFEQDLATNFRIFVTNGEEQELYEIDMIIC